MSTLIDRYVWSVLRSVPTAQRPELEPEIRALVADAVEARTGGGEAAEAADPAERAALTELGDPELLAARYTDRSMVLIGPRYFPDWRRLLTLLLPIVVPIAMIAVTAAAYAGGKPPVELVGVAISTGFGVGIQLVFWVTLVFAMLERYGEPLPTGAWTPDRLPELPTRPSLSVIELAVSLVAMIIGAGALVWVQTARPIVIEGASYPLFDPALWSFWLPYFLVLLALEGAQLVARWMRGGWTWSLAAVNLVLNVAFAVPALWLLQNGNLFDPGLETAFAGLGIDKGLAPAGAIAVIVIVAGTTWDAFEGFRQAYLRARA